MFRSRRSKTEPRPSARDPFAAVPLRPENLEVRHDSAGHVHLRVRPEIKGLRMKVAGLLGYDYSRKVQLDESGTLFMDMVDGRNRLRDIVERMVADSGKDRRGVEEGVILFTKKLMTMNMLNLRVSEPENPGRRTCAGALRPET